MHLNGIEIIIIRKAGRFFKVYEAELKTRLFDGQKEYIVKTIMNEFKSDWEPCAYYDTYFDTVNHDFANTEKELRLRKIVTGDKETFFITFKDPPFDKISKSKNEHEIAVNDYDEANVLLKQLGFIIDISFKKHCHITQIQYCSYKITITLTDIEELPETFMEIEVLTPNSNDVRLIFPILHELLAKLKISPEQLTNEYYTDMVRSINKQLPV